MTRAVTVYRDIAEAQLLPRVVRLGDNLYGAVFTLMKLVPARHILRQALDRGELSLRTTIIETTSGTFGLALAMQAALLDRRLVLVTDPVVDSKLRRRLVSLGAVVDIVPDPLPLGGYQEARLRRLAEVGEQIGDVFCPQQYANPDNPGSYAVVAEHLTDVLGTVDCVVGPVGSGGSMCGTVRHLRQASEHTVAVGVDTHDSMLFGRPDGPRVLRGLGNSLLPANLDHTIFDEVHWCTAEEAFATTRWAHQRLALYQGPTSGAALLAARWWAREHPDALCVVMLPDEGYRYQETVYDDDWIGRQGLRLGPLPTEPRLLSRAAEPSTTWSRYPWRRRTLAGVVGES